VDLLDAMLNLTYAGHEGLAVRLFDLAWPSGMEGKKEALARFKKLLNQSPFYREMRAMEKQQVVC